MRKRDTVKRVVLAIKNKAERDNVFLLSSSVAFYSFLSFIPIISVLAGVYLILNFNLDWDHFSLLKEFVPPEVYHLVEKQAQRVNSSLTTINVATLVFFFVSLWLANNVTRTLGQSLNIIFDKKSKRHFLFTFGESIVYTLAIVVSVLFLALTLTVLPIALSILRLSESLMFVLIGMQWTAFFCYMIFSLCFVYKYLPSHGTKIAWRSFLPGALVATVFGAAFALLFSFYVSNFASFNKIYGALGVIIVFMLWLRLTFASVLFGGEINYFFLKDPQLRERLSFRNLFRGEKG